MALSILQQQARNEADIIHDSDNDPDFAEEEIYGPEWNNNAEVRDILCDSDNDWDFAEGEIHEPHWNSNAEDCDILHDSDDDIHELVWNSNAEDNESLSNSLETQSQENHQPKEKHAVLPPCNCRRKYIENIPQNIRERLNQEF